jgi:hypothetical protein
MEKSSVRTTCFLLSMPMATYSLVFTSRISPSVISKTWFVELATWEQVFAVINTIAYLGVNTLFFSHLLPTALTKLRAISRRTHDILSNSFAILLALSSALSFASLAFDGFSWAGTIVAGIAGLCNFIAFGGTRYVGALNVIKLVSNSFDKHNLFQQSIVHHLQYLKPEDKQELNEFLGGKFIDESVVQEFIGHFCCRYDLLSRRKSKQESRNEFVGTCFDIILGGIMIYFVFLYFGQKGFDGINVFCKLLSKGATSLDDLTLSSKISIGSFPGASSALFMFFSAFSLRTQCLKLYKLFTHNAVRTGSITLAILVAVGLASTSVFNPAEAMVNTFNIFSVSGDSFTGKTLPIINCIGLGIAFFNFVTLQAFPYQHKVSQVSDSSVDDVITWLEKNKLSEVAVNSLRAQAFLGQSHSYLQVEDELAGGSVVELHSIENLADAVTYFDEHGADLLF